MLVEDLMKNNYLITAPAYHLLQPHYGKEFNLPELIKFVKAKGKFVIDLETAEEFLRNKGLLSIGRPKGGGEEKPPLGEGNTVESSVSTGNTTPLVATEGVEMGDTTLPVEGESSISTGDKAYETPVEAASYGNEVNENDLSGEDVPLENGDEVKVPVVYGDYGIPIAYVEEEVPSGEKSYDVYADVRIPPKEGFSYRAAQIPNDYAVILDLTHLKVSPPKAKNASGKEGEVLVESYRSLFLSRVRKMRRILRENPEVGGVIDIGKLGYIPAGEQVTVIGLVNDKRESAKGYILEIEDATGIVKAFISRDKEDAGLVKGIMHDSVIGVQGQYSGRGIIFADRIYLPDVPKFRRKKPPLEEKVYAVLLSDIHVGSNKFCEKAFEKFLEWLNGNVENEAHAELVSRIKYLILAGDVVDGIGIYPGQYNELAIPDIFDQYEALANLLRNVPGHITMFIGPGNHDAARTALPQPGFYEEYAKPIFKLKNAVIISNPAVIRLHGRDFLISHGRGIEDVVTEVPGRDHHRPAEAMMELLKLRHLAPTFGEKVPLAPDPEDFLVIESVPDLFQAGHVHVLQHLTYNGVFVINTGTWQAQTEFQKMVNIVPTPAKVPIIDVETARLRAVVNFDQFCEGV
ncbi:DNA-directed DNA polymerase II small subunit [Thermococcus sp.]